ncbi:hypothetical protein F2Q69_00028604 [Brassica cretica]|uniref:Uncharacterized protein n=1 Tax=Brassica cretica TaxID=69181 RepID=A0A8S9S0X3_BRACR|nr:hypothetical protein F2Q69_00028604 [Brassica cretica]
MRGTTVEPGPFVAKRRPCFACLLFVDAQPLFASFLDAAKPFVSGLRVPLRLLEFVGGRRFLCSLLPCSDSRLVGRLSLHCSPFPFPSPPRILLSSF